MASDAKQIKFRLSDRELRLVEGAAGTASVPEFCKRLVLECVRGDRPIRSHVQSSVDARVGARPIPKGK